MTNSVKRNSAKKLNVNEKFINDDSKHELNNKNAEKNTRVRIFTQHRIWSRFVIVIGVIVYIWYTSKNGKETSLAKQRELVPQRGQAFDCDSEYLQEISQFAGCIPKKCGRYVSDKLVTASEADVLLKIAKKGISLGGSDGGASILDLHSGALSYGEKFINIYSIVNSKKIFNAADLSVYKIVKSKIQHAIAEIFQINKKKLYLTHPTFFSKLTNVDPKTEHDEYWHVHVDKETYEAFHYTSLLYLSDFGSEFEGGRLVFVDGPIKKPANNVTLEPRKGRVAIFSSGAENVHFVERVTSGIRYAVTVSFTCDISKSISNPSVPHN